MSGQICYLVYLFHDPTVPDFSLKLSDFTLFHLGKVLVRFLVFRQHGTFEDFGVFCEVKQ